ncbi:unnamed protein product, partial [Clonostachys byssicola]
MKIDVLGLGNQEAYSEQYPNITLPPTNLRQVFATNTGWVIENDVCRHIDNINPSIDLITDVSQYIRTPEKLADERIIDLQGEYFLGEQRNLKDWAERTNSSTIVRIKPLKANSAGNILFADYQPHNPNMFSFHDPSDDIPAGPEIGYSVIG